MSQGMKEVIIADAQLQQAASEGMDAFLNVFVKATYEAIGGELTEESMQQAGHNTYRIVPCRFEDRYG